MREETNDFNTTCPSTKIVLAEIPVTEGVRHRCVPHADVRVPQAVCLPPLIVSPLACKLPDGHYAQCRGNDAKVAHIEGEVLFMMEADPLQDWVIRQAMMVTPIDSKLYAVDRSNMELHFFLCTAWKPGLAYRMNFNLFYDRLSSAWNGSAPLNATFAARRHAVGHSYYFVSDMIMSTPGHSLELVLESAAQYFRAGLHREGVAWVVPIAPRTFIHDLASQFGELLGFPVMGYLADQVYRASSMYLPTYDFADDLDHVNSTGNFKQTVLMPAAERRAASEGLTPHKKVAFLKLAGTNASATLFTAWRSHAYNESALRSLHEMGFVLLETIPYYQRVFYVNNADVILMSYGGTTTFVLNSLVPERPVKVLVAVHPGYRPEAQKATGQQLNPGEPFTVKDRLDRRGMYGYAYAHRGFRIRFVVVERLSELKPEFFVFDD